MGTQLSPEARAKLDQKLDPSRIKVREQSGRKLSYVEGYDIMNAANDIFGYDGWMHEIIGKPETVQAGQIKGLKDKEFIPGWISKATVKIGIKNDAGEWSYHTDTGLCIPAISVAKGFTMPTPDSIETAEKGAVTDAMKRAFRSLGNQFGLSLYDKDDEDSKAAQAGITGGYNDKNYSTTPENFNPPTESTLLKTKPCKNCGGVMDYKEGINKNKEKYKAYICRTWKTTNCKSEFIND